MPGTPIFCLSLTDPLSSSTRITNTTLVRQVNHNRTSDTRGSCFNMNPISPPGTRVTALSRPEWLHALYIIRCLENKIAAAWWFGSSIGKTGEPDESLLIIPPLISRLLCVGIPNAKEMIEKSTRKAYASNKWRYRIHHLYPHRTELDGSWFVPPILYGCRHPYEPQYGCFDGRHIFYQDVVRNNHINHSHAAARNQLKHIGIAIGHRWQSKMACNILPNAMVLRSRASRQHDAVYPAGT